MTRLRWLSFLSVLAASSAYADPLPKICDPKDPASCAQPIVAGQAAPFSGQLLTTKLAISIGQKAEYCDVVTKIEVDRTAEKAAIDLTAEKQLRSIDNDTAKAEREAMQKRLDQAQPWYERPWFVATVTVIITVTAYGIAMKSVEWTRPK